MTEVKTSFLHREEPSSFNAILGGGNCSEGSEEKEIQKVLP